MKKQIKNRSLFTAVLTSVVVLTFMLFAPACKKEKSGNKDNLPTITNTQAVKDFKNSDTIIVISANVSSDGGNSVTERGFVYGINPNPTTTSTTDSVKKSVTTGVGNFTEDLTGLTAGVKYYARAYATNSAGTAYGEEVNFMIEAVKIGSRFGGGIVFYVDATGQHGFITARNGLGYTGTWGCEGVSIPGTQTALGTGEANTTLIANSCSDAGNAARFCMDLQHNGYDDWFLPSKDELNLLYSNRNLALDLFSDEIRWSSSQNDNNTAWAQEFDADGGQPTRKKSSIRGARAIRAY